MVQAYWHIGKSIVEKQGGEERAEYGAKLIKELSARMTKDFGKGFTPTNLKNMRTFYLMFPKGHTLCDQLSWSHYRLIMRISNEKARQYYHDECAHEHWSVRELKRQISTLSYERLMGTGNKEAVKRGTPGVEIPKKPEDIIRDPYVLDFLGLKQNDSFYESDLEQALIDHLQEFMLELGRGFAFVGRQKRITIDGDHFDVDLVFYPARRAGHVRRQERERRTLHASGRRSADIRIEMPAEPSYRRRATGGGAAPIQRARRR